MNHGAAAVEARPSRLRPAVRIAERIEGASSMVNELGLLLPFLGENRLYAEVLDAS